MITPLALAAMLVQAPADLVIVNAETDTVVDTIRSADVYVHQMALDPTSGDIYVASVYPEHGGESRGPEGPSFVRWTR